MKMNLKKSLSFGKLSVKRETNSHPLMGICWFGGESWKKKIRSVPIFLLSVWLLTVVANFGYTQEINVADEINNIKSKEAKVRLAAIENLALSKSSESVKALVEQLKVEKDNYLKIRIIESLAGVGAQFPEALSAFVYALNDTNPQVRQSAVINLGYFSDDEKVISELSEIFDKEENESVKSAIINALSLYRSTTAVAGLSRALDKKHSRQIRLFAITKLGKIGTIQALNQLEKYKDDSDKEIKNKIKEVRKKR